MKEQQNSHKIIPLPLGNEKGEIEQGTTDRRRADTLKSRTAGRSMPPEFLARSGQRREAREVSRKTCGVRWDKTQVLKERIEAGEYRVKPEAVAEKILEHAICELARGILPGYAGRSHQAHDLRRTPASF